MPAALGRVPPGVEGVKGVVGVGGQDEAGAQLAVGWDSRGGVGEEPVRSPAP